MKEFIDFFRRERARIDADCADLLNDYRAAAFATFERTGFPSFGSESYQQTNIGALLADDFGFYLTPSARTVGDPRRMFPCTLSDLQTWKYYLVNGWLYEDELDRELPAGVFAGSLNRFADLYPALFSNHFDRQAGTSGDGLATFNTAFVQDGYVLYVPENTSVERIFQLTTVSGGERPSLTNRRILVALEAGARAELLICDHTAGEETATAATQVVEIYAGEGASLDFYTMEESNRKAVRLTSHFVRQEAGSTVNIHSITLNNGLSRNNYRMDLGRRTEACLNGVAIVDGKQQVDNFTQINHLEPDGRSSELFKYVLDDEATGAFGGKIVVSPQAQRTNAYQTNRNLSGSDRCRMYSKPQLEIYADDVKCSHGMTIGRLDESALFYMRSRGIPEAEAALLLKFAFIDEVLQGIRLETLRERLRRLIDKRFRGELIKCQGCI
jgi:Fe-S cluster assembly protein SufD